LGRRAGGLGFRIWNRCRQQGKTMPLPNAKKRCKPDQRNMQILQIQNHDFGTDRIRAIPRNLLASRGREITMFGKDRFASAGFCQTHPLFVGIFNPIFKQKI
jgi:hypothetical protein